MKVTIATRYFTIEDNAITSHFSKVLGKGKDTKKISNILSSLIIGHHCAGVNVASKKYLEGIETMLDAYSNFYGD